MRLNGATQILLRNDFLQARQCWRFELIVRNDRGHDINALDYYCAVRQDGMTWLSEHIQGINSTFPHYLHKIEEDAIMAQINYYRASYFDGRRFAILGNFSLSPTAPGGLVVPSGHVAAEFRVSANDSTFGSSFLLSHKTTVYQTFDPLVDEYTGNPNLISYTISFTPTPAAPHITIDAGTLGPTPDPDLLDLVTF